MFAPNTNCQLAFACQLRRRHERERKVLDGSWAQIFRDEIFPHIDEEPFSVLCSRPNTPVNVIVGALLIKEMLRLSDDDIVFRLMFDVSFQFALQADQREGLQARLRGDARRQRDSAGALQSLDSP